QRLHLGLQIVLDRRRERLPRLRRPRLLRFRLQLRRVPALLPDADAIGALREPYSCVCGDHFPAVLSRLSSSPGLPRLIRPSVNLIALGRSLGLASWSARALATGRSSPSSVVTSRSPSSI